MVLFSTPEVIILLLLLLYADGVRQCDPGQYGESCDRSCPLHCAPMSGSTVAVCERDTGECHEGCIPGWHGDHCSRACSSSSNCKENVCNQADGRCTFGCEENYIGDFCSEVFNEDGFRQCVPGHYGKICDKSCPAHCAPKSGSTVAVCDRDTGGCHEGCVPGWHGDHCSRACSSSNCKENVCNQADGHCTLGCNEEDIFGDFCTFVLNADGVSQCVPGHYGKSCDKSCPQNCAPKSGSAQRDCNGDSGRCYDGCVHGWHGDQCNQACNSSICKGNICNQDNGHCTQGCIGNNTGDFCTRFLVADKDPHEKTGHVPLIISLVIAAVLVVLVVLVILGILLYRRHRRRRRDRKRQKYTRVSVNLELASNPTNQDEMEEPLIAAQKIKKRTEFRIQSWTKDTVETEALHKVTDKLDGGATWVTIKGRPGEGKSTIAYMALKDQQTLGRQVYQVVSPEEFNDVITAYANPVIMLDDIFGHMEFDVAEWAKWRPSLQPIVDANDSDKRGSERTNDEQRQVQRTGQKTGKAIIILVGCDYVLKSSLPDLGKMADYISCPQYVVEVPSQRDVDERKKIWHVHAKTKHIDFDESTVSRICQADCPHGFHHVCKMFITHP